MSLLQGKKILIIDDAADIRHFVRKILEGAGATVHEASSVDEGEAVAAEKSPHLLITDINMPEKTGFDLLKVHHRNDHLKSIPVVVLSGISDRASVNQAIALGAKDYILKPIRAPLLLQKVRKQLRSVTFLSRRFDVGERPTGSVSIPVDIRRVNEAGFQVELAIRLSPEETVSVNGGFLEEIGCGSILTRTSQKPEPRFYNGRYISEIGFVGINEMMANRIREALRKIK